MNEDGKGMHDHTIGDMPRSIKRRRRFFTTQNSSFGTGTYREGGPIDRP